MAPVFREVHRSNMSKVGGYKRADGTWIKPSDYSPARLQPILAAQGSLAYNDEAVVSLSAPAQDSPPQVIQGELLSCCERSESASLSRQEPENV